MVDLDERLARRGHNRLTKTPPGAEDRDHARRAVAVFKLAYGAKFPKAIAKITLDQNPTRP